ncbi:MAG: PCYCGC motif-containing (lipo)protein [Gemmatimonadaceae bacterium]
MVLNRRRFLAVIPLALLARAAGATSKGGLVLTFFDPGSHPTPRPGITASRVLTSKALHNKAATPVYDMVRQIPQVVDGIHCYCGCANVEGFHSLLTCFEKDGMAQHCDICQGEARMVYKLHTEGWSLNGIRASIDAAFAES